MTKGEAYMNAYFTAGMLFLDSENSLLSTFYAMMIMAMEALND